MIRITLYLKISLSTKAFYESLYLIIFGYKVIFMSGQILLITCGVLVAPLLK